MCDYVVRCLKVVRGKPIMQDTLALIQQLEADNASKDERIQMLEAGLAQWHDVAASPGAVEDMARENYRLTQELAVVKRERKALMLDFQTCVKRTRKVCSVCSNKGKPICNECEGCDVFEWRGVCPDNTEVQE